MCRAYIMVAQHEKNERNTTHIAICIFRNENTNEWKKRLWKEVKRSSNKEEDRGKGTFARARDDNEERCHFTNFTIFVGYPMKLIHQIYHTHKRNQIIDIIPLCVYAYAYFELCECVRVAPVRQHSLCVSSAK